MYEDFLEDSFHMSMSLGIGWVGLGFGWVW